MPTDPNTALLFFVAGLLGIYAEFCFPGTVIPGAAGGVLFLLSIAGFVEIGVRWSAVCILVGGFVLLAAEALLHTRWVLATAGVVLVAAGSMRLHNGIRPGLAVAVTVPLAIITVVLFSTAVRARENKNQKVGVVFWRTEAIFSFVGVDIPRRNGTHPTEL